MKLGAVPCSVPCGMWDRVYSASCFPMHGISVYLRCHLLAHRFFVFSSVFVRNVLLRATILLQMPHVPVGQAEHPIMDHDHGSDSSHHREMTDPKGLFLDPLQLFLPSFLPSSRLSIDGADIHSWPANLCRGEYYMHDQYPSDVPWRALFFRARHGCLSRCAP